MDEQQDPVEELLTAIDQDVMHYDSAVMESGSELLRVESALCYAQRDEEPMAKGLALRSNLIEQQRRQLARLLGSLLAQEAIERVDNWFDAPSTEDVAGLAIMLTDLEGLVDDVREAIDAISGDTYICCDIADEEIIREARRLLTSR